MLRESGLDVPGIVVSGVIGDEGAVSVLRDGAADYLLKDRLERLGMAVDQSLAGRRRRREAEQAAAALRESERFNRATLDALGAHVAVIDADGLLLATNAAWRRFARENGGDERTTGEGANYLAACERAAAGGDADAARMATGLRQVITGGREAWFMEYACPSATEQRWFLSTVRRFPGDGPVRVVVTHENVTMLRLAEAALRESEERHRLLFEGNPLPMWLFDRETLRFLAVNESAVRQYGHSREEFLALTIKDIRPPEDVPALLEWLAANSQDTMRRAERRHRRKDGSVIEVETTSRPLRYQGRDVRLVVANDITERRLLEEKFLHAQRLESLGMLAAGIAHDLNNVLAPMMFAAPLLRESLHEPRELKILDTLEQSAERGAGLVRQILGFARASAGEFAPTALKHLVRDIVGVIEGTFPKSIVLEHHLAADLWPVRANATQIHQVLLNLCVNARDAMPAGGVLRIAGRNLRLDEVAAARMDGARPGAWVVIEVTDTGTGIPPEIVGRIWDPFFTSKPPGKGTGLGLSTVRGIVANHQGFVELNTVVGHGTTFRVYLPAAEDEMAGAEKVAREAAEPGHGEFVLVVDDDQIIRDLVGEILSQGGYRVAKCRDGVEALEFFDGHRDEVGLVVTDVDMPRMGGAALTQALLRLRPGLRVLAMSGLPQHATESSDVPAIRRLAGAFLHKPFGASELLHAVHGLLLAPALAG